VLAACCLSFNYIPVNVYTIKTADSGLDNSGLLISSKYLPEIGPQMWVLLVNLKCGKKKKLREFPPRAFHINRIVLDIRRKPYEKNKYCTALC
jgi:hypothetical protein